MEAIVRAGFLAHAQTRGFKSRVERSLEAIQDWLVATEGRAYVAVSGGKDSLAMAGLIQQVCPGLPMVWVNQGPLAEWESCAETLDRLRNDRGWAIVELCPPRSLWNLYLDLGIPLGASMNSALDKQINKRLIYDPIDDWLTANPMLGCAVGIRKQESKGRKAGITKYGTLFKNQQGLWICWPVAHWTVDDIWAFILSTDLPYPSLYDPDPRNIRNGPPIGTTGISRGRLTALRERHPEYWSAFVAKFPELASYH